eukprot:TRINITY_DN4656_c0_g1_i2.p2 TRINITY_DN4656_c0_g1~~TRINITY_DN4656_c0_g1_i2.p2  ORF type:complete len:138 (-),score=29.20 TRINITY_DN4656_c0_g1_i2:69-482(-)
MIRRPPRSTQGVSSAASDVYKRQVKDVPGIQAQIRKTQSENDNIAAYEYQKPDFDFLLYGNQLVSDYTKRCNEELEELQRHKVMMTLPSPQYNGPRVTRTQKLLEESMMSASLQHTCLLYTSPSPRDLSTSRMPSSA